MIKALANIDEARMHSIQQSIKWTVYVLLLINFGYYLYEDTIEAIHTLNSDSSILEWTSAFATSIDESAWFILLAMFELETYIIDDEKLKGWVVKLLHGVRMVCIVMIAHTIFAFSVDVSDLKPTVIIENASSLCDLTDSEYSYIYNVKYSTITSDNCASLSSASTLYQVGNDPLVTSLMGLELERDLALVDLLEVIFWVVVLLAIEVVVRIQSAGQTSGAAISAANGVKILTYTTLLGLGIYWASLGHWLYLWDEVVWIGGFAAIEMNLSSSRDEILDFQAAN